MIANTDGTTYEALRDGLLQDLIAVRLLIRQAGPALREGVGSLGTALEQAGAALDADIADIRAVMSHLKDAEAA